MKLNKAPLLFFALTVFTNLWAAVDPATALPMPATSRALPVSEEQSGREARKVQLEFPLPAQRKEIERDEGVGRMPQLLGAKLELPKSATEKKLIIFNEWLVSSPSIEAANRERTQLSEFGLKIKRRQWLPNLGFVIGVYSLPLNADPLELRDEVLRKYPQLQIEFNQRYPLQGSSGGEAAKHYGYQLTGISERGCEKFNATIAMMDSKMNQNLKVFQDHQMTLEDVSNNSEVLATDHGTAVAAILLEILPKAKLLAINVYQMGDDGLETRSDWLLSGFDQVLAHKPTPLVLNMSFGGNDSRLLEQAIKKLDVKGIRLVAAAGNGGRQALPIFPAAYKEVRAVSAVDVKAQLWRGSNQGEYVAFAAPGVDIWTLNAQGEGQFSSGTSYAAPWVTVAAALASDEQWQKPAAMARDLGKLGRDSSFGYGLIQLGSLCRKD